MANKERKRRRKNELNYQQNQEAFVDKKSKPTFLFLFV